MLARPREDGELFRLVGQLQWRLARERALVFGLRGATIGAAIVLVLGVVGWLAEVPLADWSWALAVAAALAGLALGVVRWPSAMQAARAADHHLELAERLATAVELSRRQHSHRAGRFDRLQLEDALRQAQAPPGHWPSLTQRHQRDLQVALAAGLLAIATMLLPALPHPRLDHPEAAPPAEAVDTSTDQARTSTFELDSPFQTGSSSSVASPNDDQASEEQLAQRVQQAQAARQALDRLANALSQVSASQSVGQAIERGDYQGARDQLANLGDEADQLSTAAKQQLSTALQSAANQTAASDRQLADRERAAAQSLARGYYNEERQALRALGDQVQRSAQNSPSQGQLARDQGRLEQARSAGQQSRTSTDDGQGGAQNGNASAQSGAQASANARDGSSSNGGQQAAGAPGQSGLGDNGSGDGQQAGSGAGVGTTDPLGDPAGRLDAAGQRVEVPVKLGPGPGERPATGNDDPSGQPYGSTQGLAAEQGQHQDPSQVLPENNLVPGEQRPVIRGYFTGEGPGR
jgi:hypothetical protein